jgi:hypothetical protein
MQSYTKGEAMTREIESACLVISSWLASREQA